MEKGEGKEEEGEVSEVNKGKGTAGPQYFGLTPPPHSRKRSSDAAAATSVRDFRDKRIVRRRPRWFLISAGFRHNKYAISGRTFANLSSHETRRE